MGMKLIFKTKNKMETRSLGKTIAPLLEPGDVLLLEGDLGAGKTTFTGGVAEGLGVKEDVISPTFNIMKCYFHGRIPLYHIDAYRLEGQNIEIGLDEYIEGDGACLIEWPAYIEPLLPEERLSICIKNEGDDNRQITLESNCQRFDNFLKELKEKTDAQSLA